MTNLPPGVFLINTYTILTLQTIYQRLLVSVQFQQLSVLTILNFTRIETQTQYSKLFTQRCIKIPQLGIFMLLDELVIVVTVAMFIIREVLAPAPESHK